MHCLREQSTQPCLREQTQYEHTCSITRISIGSCPKDYHLCDQMLRPVFRPEEPSSFKLSMVEHGLLQMKINSTDVPLLLIPADADHDVSTWQVQVPDAFTFTASIPCCIQEGWLLKAGLHGGLNWRFARVFVGSGGQSYLKIFRSEGNCCDAHTIQLSGITAWQHSVTEVRVPWLWLLGQQHWFTFSPADGHGRAHSLLLGHKQLRLWEDAFRPRTLTVCDEQHPSFVDLVAEWALSATEHCTTDLSSSVGSLPSSFPS
jgi:hypothetical protein